MNEIFEAIVEQLFREYVTQTNRWDERRIEWQANVTGLVTGGSPRVTTQPDAVIRNADDEVVFTGDTKWKLRLSRSHLTMVIVAFM